MDAHHCCSEDLETYAVQTTNFTVTVSTGTHNCQANIKLLQCYEDALNLYKTLESNRSQLQTMLQAALAHVRQAMREVQIVEDQLLEADLQTGRARTIIKKSGFADVLRRKNCIGIKVTESNCASHFLYLIPGYSFTSHS